MIPPEAPATTAPAARPPRSAGRRVFAVVSSPKLAIALLLAVLACSVAGVSVYKGEEAWALIFSTLWFNGLLVLLALSSGLTFLARIWGRKVTLISVGMIVFHVCFLALLGGVVFNSLFHFKAVLRLTEGETLPNGDPASYDTIEAGRFFDFASLRGETTLIKLHRGYKVDGLDKRAAYEIAVGEGPEKTKSTIYMTQNLDHHGVRYLVAKEGYSIGVILHDKQGAELYAAMVPLQSLKRGESAILYASGTPRGPSSFPFPPPPAAAALLLQVSYVPDQQTDRAGHVEFTTWPVSELEAEHGSGSEARRHGGPAAERGTDSGPVPVGGTFDAGEYQLEAREVRYWVGMTVRHDPGLMLILSSLWAGLGGMTMTFAGRILQDAKRGKREAGSKRSDTMASRETP